MRNRPSLRSAPSWAQDAQQARRQKWRIRVGERAIMKPQGWDIPNIYRPDGVGDIDVVNAPVLLAALAISLRSLDRRGHEVKQNRLLDLGEKDSLRRVFAVELRRRSKSCRQKRRLKSLPSDDGGESLRLSRSYPLEGHINSPSRNHGEPSNITALSAKG